MAEYIKRESAIEAIMSDPPDAHYQSWYAEKIKAIPAADVAPVRHGRWIDRGDYVTTAYGSLPVNMCSECHMDVTLEDFDSYCPNCGARMEGGAD